MIFCNESIWCFPGGRESARVRLSNTATNPGGSSLGEVSARPLASAELQGPYVGISVLLIFSVGKNVDPSIRSLVMECSFEITLPLGVFAVSLFVGASPR